MADLKISQLTGATTPLSGTEVVPLVQSNTTKKVAVSDLTAGRAVSGASFAATDFVTATNYILAGSGSNLAILKPKNIEFYNAGTVEGTISCSDDSSAFVSIGLTKTTARIATGNTNRLSVDSGGNVTVNTGNLVIGTSGKGISLPGGITWTSGSGSPEGVVTAPIGSLYSRSDGGLLTSFYVKESGSGNTGWVGK